jgi:hypothetical protein
MLLGGWSKGCSLEDYTQVNNPLFFSLLNKAKIYFTKDLVIRKYFLKRQESYYLTCNC